jgi:glycosyltransferase involved in cell wall biosynthesis
MIKTMNIFFDMRWTRVDTIDGLSRYGSSLAAALHRLHPITVIVYDKRQLRLLPDNVPYVMVNHPFSPRELFLPRRLNKLGADVVFSPLQTMGTWGRHYKLILTLQDLIYYEHSQPPTFLPLPVRVLWRLFHMAYWPQRLLLNQADEIATVSQTSKKYIEKHRLTNRSVHVVYNAPLELKNPPKSTGLTRDILYMGSFMPYKNAELLITGMEDLPEYTLHLLSKISPARKAELEKIIPKGAKIKFWNGISEDDYRHLLANAWVLATASRSEGFGLPIIEAMALGVPVVCSDTEIFHEVGGQAALYFPSDSPKVFAQKVRKLENDQIRQQAVQEGKTQAAKFNWHDSAETLLDIINNL